MLWKFAFVIFEPASWFVMWSGLDDIFRGWKRLQGDLDFYSRMSEAKISFIPY
jgi:predicted small integral membrane protein